MTRPDQAALHASMEAVLAQIIQGFMSAMKQHGLSTPQIHALMYLFHNGECGVSDIGALAEVSNAAASQLVERLVRQGLVERGEDPADRRNKLLTLSQKGKGLIHAGVMSNRFLRELLGSLAPKERQAVHEAFALLGKAGRQVPGNRQHDPGDTHDRK